MHNHSEHTDDEEIELLRGRHAELERQIEAIERKPHVTEADELEEQRLKKLKLHVKDQLNELTAHHKHAAV